MNLHKNLQIAKAVVASTVLAVLAGCDGTNVTEQLHVHNPVNATVYVASATGVSRNDQTGTGDALATGLDGGVAMDQARNLVQVDSGGDITTFCSAADIAGTPVAGTFRTVTGAAGAVNVEIAHEAGAYIVTNGTGTVEVYASNAGAGAAALATFNTPANAAGLAYDDPADRLFVALDDGTVAVFDDFVADGFGQSGEARVIDPYDEVTAGTTSELSGIAYDAQQDRLVVSDVGDLADTTDGRIFVIEGASTADGDTDPSVTIEGPATGLGNPVALSLKGVALRVADTGTDQVLFYANVFVAGDGDIAPSESYASADPVGLVVDPVKIFPAVNHTNGSVSNIAYVSNQPSAATQVQHYDTGLTTAGNTFDTGEVSVENLTFDVNGDGYATFDDNTDVLGSGGVMIVHRLAKGRDGDAGIDADRDRTITGATAGLAAPKGVIMLGGTGYLAVAESSANGVDGAGVYVYNACQSGNTAPAFTVATTGTPWDMDYFAAADILFVAQTNGTVDIYNGFLAALQAGDPQVVVTVTLTAATNLHGIHYDVGSDTLILSDVVDPGNATDGLLFVVQDVSGLIGYAGDPNGDEDAADALAAVDLPLDDVTNGYANTPYEVRAEGATVFGNPVDIAFDGANLYVANKSGMTPGILLFEDFLDVLAEDAFSLFPDDTNLPADADTDPDEVCEEDGAGTCEDFIVDAEATTELPATAAESISLVPDFLSTAP